MKPDFTAPVHPGIGAACKCARFAVDELEHALKDPAPMTLRDAERYLETALLRLRDAQSAQAQEPVA